jgi:hypothetical protein
MAVLFFRDVWIDRLLSFLDAGSVSIFVCGGEARAMPIGCLAAADEVSWPVTKRSEVTLLASCEVGCLAAADGLWLTARVGVVWFCAGGSAVSRMMEWWQI